MACPWASVSGRGAALSVKMTGVHLALVSCSLPLAEIPRVAAASGVGGGG